MKIEKPIFIVGSGRSGTSILYSLLSTHPEVCWFSNLTNRYPAFPELALLHRILDIPFLGTQAKKRIVRSLRFLPKPGEGERIYESFCGFKQHKKTTEDDLDQVSEIRLKKNIETHQRLTGKRRFLSKRTSNVQRVRLLHKMFPDAYYIHIIRDGRAVANSFLRVKWWENIDIWWLEDTPAVWNEKGGEPIELSALHWKHDVEEILNNKYLFEDRYLELRYEELADDTKNAVMEITDFCELSRDRKFFDLVPETLPNMNSKWEEQLTERQKVVLNSSISQFLVELGYKL